jgi:hypothetical protein
VRSSLLAEFGSADAVLVAAEHLRARGYTRLEAYTPFHMPELEEVLGKRRSKLPVGVFTAGITGTGTAFIVIWFTNAINYPINVGGRPLNSFLADIPIMFETTVLFAGVTSFMLALVLNGLPRLYDALSEVEGFERASIDRFWIRIEARDPSFEPRVRDELSALGAMAFRTIGEVP